MIIQERKVRRLVALLTGSLLSLQAFIVPAAAMQVQEEPAPAITADQYQFEDGDFKSSPNILLPKGMTEPVFVNPETDSSETERESSAIQNNSADTSLQTMVSGQMNLDVSSVAAVFPSQNGMYLYYMRQRVFKQQALDGTVRDIVSYPSGYEQICRSGDRVFIEDHSGYGDDARLVVTTVLLSSGQVEGEFTLNDSSQWFNDMLVDESGRIFLLVSGSDTSTIYLYSAQQCH
ncbi:hypothetical protein [Allobaculum mucilyticum]|uniref:hypothetical protein n=1 Tax=Allobaculum mucilyticum TaxID=2834459 RepID=UPI001E3EFB37|nr:hypothetical protein [Allobaculum mucilyticum]UNT96650.1 hypothetical protein KWG62_02505 [Allobaculum mucilyticum]